MCKKTIGVCIDEKNNIFPNLDPSEPFGLSSSAFIHPQFPEFLDVSLL